MAVTFNLWFANNRANKYEYIVACLNYYEIFSLYVLKYPYIALNHTLKHISRFVSVSIYIYVYIYVYVFHFIAIIYRNLYDTTQVS